MEGAVLERQPLMSRPQRRGDDVRISCAHRTLETLLIRILATLLALFTSPLLFAGWNSFTSKTPTGPAAFDQNSAVVASNGFDYLVAWTTATPIGGAIATQRVNADGTLEGVLPRPLDPSPNDWTVRNARALSMSPSRDGYFLSWLSDAGLNVAMTDAYGVPIRRMTYPRPPAPALARTRTAWNGAVHLVLAAYKGPFDATLIDNNGNVIAADVPIGNTHGEPTHRDAVVADASGFLVLSTKATPSGTDIYARRINTNGVPGEWFLVRSTPSIITGLAAHQDGSDTIVVWSDRFGIWMLRLDAANRTTSARQLISATVWGINGIVRHGDDFVLAHEGQLLIFDRDGRTLRDDRTGASISALATNGSRVLSIGLATRPTTGLDVVGRFLLPEPEQSDFVVALSSALQQNGDLARGDGRLMAVWDQTFSGGRHVFASLRGATGPFAPPEGIQLSSGGGNAAPSAAFNGTYYLVAWTRTAGGLSETVARRVTRDGMLLDATDLVLGRADSSSPPRVASDGDGWLVVWTLTSGGSSCAFAQPPPRLRAGRIASSGAVLEPEGVVISQVARVQQDADLVWSGTEYVVVWREHCPPPRSNYPSFSWINAATLSADLRRIEVHAISPESAPQNVSRSRPRVAAAGDRVAVAWQQGPDTIEYRHFVGGLPRAARRRAIGAPVSIPSTTGRLRGVVTYSDGTFALLADDVIPWANAYRGTFSLRFDAAGALGSRRFYSATERDPPLTGRPVALDGVIYMAEAMFVPSEGSDLLFARAFGP